jgi:hypothetical protein
VVASQNEEVLRVLDLVCEQQADGLERLLASIDVVTEEEIVGLRREATILEQAQKVVVLAVNIATDLCRTKSTFVFLVQTYLRGDGKCERVPSLY